MAMLHRSTFGHIVFATASNNIIPQLHVFHITNKKTKTCDNIPRARDLQRSLHGEIRDNAWDFDAQRIAKMLSAVDRYPQDRQITSVIIFACRAVS